MVSSESAGTCGERLVSSRSVTEPYRNQRANPRDRRKWAERAREQEKRGLRGRAGRREGCAGRWNLHSAQVLARGQTSRSLHEAIFGGADAARSEDLDQD